MCYNNNINKNDSVKLGGCRLDAGAVPAASTINTLEVNMLEAIANWVSKFINVKPQPGYLGRDMAQHRVHSTKYEDLCK